jgi:uncharacterized protein (DUF2062 family)
MAKNMIQAARLLPDRQRMRARADAWLARHPLIERFLRRTGCLSVHRRALARGVAVGLFIGLTPTVGVQTVLILVACLALRANFPAAFAASWISNPVTMGPLYFAYAVIGETILGDWLVPVFMTLFQLTQIVAETALQLLSIGFGSLLIAAPAAGAGYLISLLLNRYAAVRRLKARRG